MYCLSGWGTAANTASGSLGKHAWSAPLRTTRNGTETRAAWPTASALESAALHWLSQERRVEMRPRPVGRLLALRGSPRWQVLGTRSLGSRVGSSQRGSA